MGTWGIGPFDNDVALDWTHELANEGPRFLIASMARVSDAEADAYLGVATCQEALAAVGTVLGLSDDLEVPDAVADWHRRHPELPDGLRAMAAEVLRRVLEASELADLWLEEGDQGWRVATARLAQRLG